MEAVIVSQAARPVRFTDADIVPFLSATPGIVAVDVAAEWCIPCKLLRPILHKLAAEFKGRVTLVELDADRAKDFCAEHKVESYPTVLYFAEGRLVGRHEDFEGAAKAREALMAVLGHRDEGTPSAAELAFQDACRRADAAFETIMDPPFAAFRAQFDVLKAQLDAFKQGLAKELAEGRLSQADVDTRGEAERTRLNAALKDKREAMKRAEPEALAAYEAVMNEAVAKFAQDDAKASAGISRAKACRPGDPFCAV